MSYPILYSPTEGTFDHNGIGILSACCSCKVTEEANGQFELKMEYPIDGIHYKSIVGRSIIKAKPNQFADYQLFRVYSISKKMSKIAIVKARHISYDLSGIPSGTFTATNVVSALNGLRENAVLPCPFEFWTDKETEANFKVENPSSVRSLLGGVAGSILDVYGGDYEFDNFTVKLHNNRGKNRGVSIRYGKNLTDLKQDEEYDNLYTGVYPFWKSFEDGSVTQLPEKIVACEGDYGFERILTLDATVDFTEKPTEDQLRNFAKSYIKNNGIGVPSVSTTIKFEQLSKSEEYKHLNLLERVSLFDVVSVEFADIGVSTTAKVVKVVYDCMLDRVDSASIGKVKANISSLIVNQQQQIEKLPSSSELEQAKNAATAWLTNGKGYKVERRGDDGSVIDTLYMDTPDINTAVNVLRIGQSGIGFSNSGVNGTYISAWTIDGKFNADFITAGTLNAALVKVINLTAEAVFAKNSAGEYVRIANGEIIAGNNSAMRESFSLRNIGSKFALQFLNTATDSSDQVYSEFSWNSVKLGGISETDAAFSIEADRMNPNAPGYVKMQLPGEDGEKAINLYIYWRRNAATGVYTLIGLEEMLQP